MNFVHSISLCLFGGQVLSHFLFFSPACKEVIDIPNEAFVFLVGEKSSYQEKIE